MKQSKHYVRFFGYEVVPNLGYSGKVIVGKSGIQACRAKLIQMKSLPRASGSRGEHRNKSVSEHRQSALGCVG